MSSHKYSLFSPHCSLLRKRTLYCKCWLILSAKCKRASHKKIKLYSSVRHIFFPTWSLNHCILTRREAHIWWWPTLAACSAGWQVWVVLRRQHNQPLWRKESFTPLRGNLSCQLRRLVDEIQGELKPVCLGWENEGSGLCRQGCGQGEKERAVCKQLPFGSHRWTEGYFKIKAKVVLLKGQSKFFNPSSLAKLPGTWSRVQYSVFKGSCPHYGM